MIDKIPLQVDFCGGVFFMCKALSQRKKVMGLYRGLIDGAAP